jgi:hypothetical protein
MTTSGLIRLAAATVRVDEFERELRARAVDDRLRSGGPDNVGRQMARIFERPVRTTPRRRTRPAEGVNPGGQEDAIERGRTRE